MRIVIGYPLNYDIIFPFEFYLELFWVVVLIMTPLFSFKFDLQLFRVVLRITTPFSLEFDLQLFWVIL